jgi:hypothetical protein
MRRRCNTGHILLYNGVQFLMLQEFTSQLGIDGHTLEQNVFERLVETFVKKAVK